MWIFCRDVGNVDDLPCLDEAAHIGWNRWVAPSKFFELTRSAMHSHQSKLTFLEQQQSAALGFADAGGACQHCLKHRLKVAGGACNDAQDFVSCRLPLQSFAKLTLRLRQAAFEIGSGLLCHRAVPALGLKILGPCDV